MSKIKCDIRRICSNKNNMDCSPLLGIVINNKIHGTIFDEGLGNEYFNIYASLLYKKGGYSTAVIYLNKNTYPILSISIDFDNTKNDAKIIKNISIKQVDFVQQPINFMPLVDIMEYLNIAIYQYFNYKGTIDGPKEDDINDYDIENIRNFILNYPEDKMVTIKTKVWHYLKYLDLSQIDNPIPIFDYIKIISSDRS